MNSRRKFQSGYKWQISAFEPTTVETLGVIIFDAGDVWASSAIAGSHRKTACTAGAGADCPAMRSANAVR